jgi:hypothetical protein
MVEQESMPGAVKEDSEAIANTDQHTPVKEPAGNGQADPTDMSETQNTATPTPLQESSTNDTSNTAEASPENTATASPVSHTPAQSISKAGKTTPVKPKPAPAKKSKKRRSRRDDFDYESSDYEDDYVIRRTSRTRRKSQKLLEMEEDVDRSDDPYSDEDDTCICNKGFRGKFMLDCDSCHKWFHGICVGVEEDNMPTHWYCDNCSKRTDAGRRRRRVSKPREAKMDTWEMAEYIDELRETMKALTEDLKQIKEMEVQEPQEPQEQSVEEPKVQPIITASPTISKKPTTFIKRKNPPIIYPMTREEKQKLNEDLNRLPTEKLFRVVNIINDKDPSALNSVNDEISIDLDVLDDETLRSIERICKSSNKGKKKSPTSVQSPAVSTTPQPI